MPVTKKQFEKLVLSLPHLAAGTSYGKPSFLLMGKFFTRWRDEDKAIVLQLGSIDERDMLLEADPKTFFITDHYRNYPDILARASQIGPKALRALLGARWLKMMPKKMLGDQYEIRPANSRAKRQAAKRPSRK